MAKFIRLHTVKSYKKKGRQIRYVKYRKHGTKTEFFNPEVDGKRLTPVMYARLWEAESTVKYYLSQQK